jgi:hypothetical protein
LSADPTSTPSMSVIKLRVINHTSSLVDRWDPASSRIRDENETEDLRRPLQV